MSLRYSYLGLIILVVGLVLSIIGMVSYTGLVEWGAPVAVMYAGYAVAVVGLAMVFRDLQTSRDIISEYYEERDIREMLDDVPDDDYCVDISGTEDVSKEEGVLITSKRDEPFMIDLTRKVR